MWRLGGSGGTEAGQEDLEVEAWVEFLSTCQPSIYILDLSRINVSEISKCALYRSVLGHN